MTRTVNIACLQTSPAPDFGAALEQALALAAEAADGGAGLIALPEYCGGLRSENGALSPPAAKEESHPVLAGLRGFAQRRGVWMLVGSLAIPRPDGRLLNRSFVLGADGSIRARYDKIHLFDVDLSETESYRESDRVAPGDAALPVETPWGILGQTICYDLRFPGLYRQLAIAGAEILCIPAAFTRTTGEAHWHVLNRARAIENGAFVVSPCAVGPVTGGGETYGHSLIVDPWGSVLADGGTAPGIVSARIDLDMVAETRRRVPSLRHGRPFGDGAARRSVA